MAIGISEGIPDAESSDAVQSVFEFDEGFLQCRPVGHKSKRMVFVDYDSIEHATRALQAHQGWKWEPVDEGGMKMMKWMFQMFFFWFFFPALGADYKI